MDEQRSEYRADVDGGLWKAAVVTTTALLKILSFSAFFDTAASSLAALLHADGAALIVRDGPDHLKYRLFYGMEHINREKVGQFRFAAGQGTVGRALATGSPLFTPHYVVSPDAMPEFVAAGLRSNLVVPLPGPNGFLGAVAISWIHREAPELEPPTLAIVEMFAALIGGSLYREELEDQLSQLSLLDPLTGLPNRRMLMVRLGEAQKRAYRHQTLLVIAVIDLDGFKRLNDVLGHAAGDQMLQRAADKLVEGVRSVDMVVRHGGDEFIVILEDIRSLSEARSILRRLVESLNTQVKKDAVTVNIRSSIGATVYPLDFADPDTLLRHADDSMYEAKRLGGDTFVLRTSFPVDEPAATA